MVFDGADRHAQDAEQSHGAAQVGLAASTCSGRLRALRERGIITGFHADIGLEALGVYVFGMISVRMTPVGRSKIGSIPIGPKPRHMPREYDIVGVQFVSGTVTVQAAGHQPTCDSSTSSTAGP